MLITIIIPFVNIVISMVMMIIMVMMMKGSSPWQQFVSCPPPADLPRHDLVPLKPDDDDHGDDHGDHNDCHDSDCDFDPDPGTKTAYMSSKQTPKTLIKNTLLCKAEGWL